MSVTVCRRSSAQDFLRDKVWICWLKWKWTSGEESALFGRYLNNQQLGKHAHERIKQSWLSCPIDHIGPKKG
jgi:hypothetical protein